MSSSRRSLAKIYAKRCILYTTGFFTTGILSGIVASVNKGEARKGKNMITARFTLSHKEPTELRQSSLRYLDGFCVRSFKAKWDKSMVL